MCSSSRCIPPRSSPWRDYTSSGTLPPIFRWLQFHLLLSSLPNRPCPRASYRRLPLTVTYCPQHLPSLHFTPPPHPTPNRCRQRVFRGRRTSRMSSASIQQAASSHFDVSGLIDRLATELSRWRTRFRHSVEPAFPFLERAYLSRP